MRVVGIDVAERPIKRCCVQRFWRGLKLCPGNIDHDAGQHSGVSLNFFQGIVRNAAVGSMKTDIAHRNEAVDERFGRLLGLSSVSDNGRCACSDRGCFEQGVATHVHSYQEVGYSVRAGSISFPDSQIDASSANWRVMSWRSSRGDSADLSAANSLSHFEQFEVA